MKTWSIVILPYMIDKMKLSGNNLVAYAFVNGFCSSSGHGWHGNMSTMAKHTGMSVKTCQRCLSFLEEKGFVKKIKTKTVFETEAGSIINTLPLYIAIYSEAEKLEVENEVECKEPKESPETKLEKKDKVVKEKNKDTRFEESKGYYLDVYKKLYEQGKVPTELTSVNSGLINKRLKGLFSKNVTPLQIKLSFEEMEQSDFCVETLKFELAPLLSDTVFFKFYNKAAERYKKKKELNGVKRVATKEVLRCSTCGGEIYDGECYNCNLSKLI